MTGAGRTIYTLDYVDVVGGREVDYLASSHSLVWGSEMLGETAVLQFRATGALGSWPAAVNLWERSWDTWRDTAARRFVDADRHVGIEQWWQANVDVRTGGLDFVMVASPGTEPLALSGPRAGHCPLFLVELAQVRAGAVTELIAAADELLAADVDSLGGVLVGAYRVLWRPMLLVTVLGVPSFAAVTALADPGAGAGSWAKHRADALVGADARVMIPAASNPRGSKVT